MLALSLFAAAAVFLSGGVSVNYFVDVAHVYHGDSPNAAAAVRNFVQQLHASPAGIPLPPFERVVKVELAEESRADCFITGSSHEMRVNLKEIAERTNLPQPYLEQILLSVKGAGLVRSKRGVGGGYVLARDPGEITLADIVGKDDSHFFDLEQSNALKLNDAEVMTSGRAVEREERDVVKATGEQRIYWTVKSPLRDASGNVIGLCGMSVDITPSRH